MSAHVVSSTHIAVLAHYAVDHQACPGKPDYNAIYRALASANVASVCSRYANEKPESYSSFIRPQGRAAASRMRLTPVEVLKLCDSLEYQSCEFGGWADSIACRILERIREAAVSSLPGYREAAWVV